MTSSRKRADILELGDEIRRAEYAISVRRYDLAIEIMQRFLSTHPENSIAFYTIARAYTLKGEQQKAIATYIETLRLDPNNSMSHALYASQLKDMKHYPLAEHEAMIAIQLDPTNHLAHYIYANIFLKEKKETTKAIQHSLRALELAPEKADYHVTLGSLLASTGNIPAAEAEFQRALNIDPENEYAHNSYGVLLLNQKHAPQEALKHFRIALMQTPNNEAIRRNFFIALKAKNKFYALFLNYTYLRRKMGKAYILLPLGLFAFVWLLSASSVTAPIAGLMYGLYGLFVLYLLTVNPLLNFLLKRGWLR